MFTYQKTNRYFAQIADGMEELGKDELASLGAQDINIVFRGLFLTADKETLYRINYMTRLCTRVLAPLITFDCHSTKYLYKTALGIDWPELFSINQTFCISANLTNSKIRHSQYASLCLKDAIVDQFRERFEMRPNVERINPDIHFNLHIDNNKATIYLDTSGGSLHRRGYRKEAVEAPMQENLAAAIIKLSGWDGRTPLYDPMCGSGTLLLEAVMHYCNIPAGYRRDNFGFTFLPDFDGALWESVKSEADESARELPKGLIAGSDIQEQAVAAARANARNLPGGMTVTFTRAQFMNLPDLNDSTIVCNPPYGRRMGSKDELGLMMKDFGDFLKQRCKGSTAYIYFGNRELIKKVGLRSAFKIPLKNGPLDGRLVKFELY
jgi:putative N6-adenine-specific DNA methylase